MDKINYNKHDWQNLELITEGLMDNMEDGIAQATDKINEVIDEVVNKIRVVKYESVEGTTFKEKIANLVNKAKQNSTMYILDLEEYKKYEIQDDEIEIDFYYVAIRGNFSTLEYTGNNNSSYFINITNSIIDNNKRFLKDIFITSKSYLNQKIGLVFGGNTTKGTSNIVCNNLSISNFNIALDFRSNSYLIRFNECDMRGTVYMDDKYVNYGEDISFTGCTFYNTAGTNIVNKNSNGDFRLTSCSLDYSQKVAECYGGTITIENSHIEFRLNGQNGKIYNFEAFTCEGSNARINISNSRILGTQNDGTGNNAINRPYIFVVNGDDINGSGRGLINVTNCELWGLQTTSGELCGGNENGIFMINGSHSNSVPMLPAITKKNNAIKNEDTFIVKCDNCSYTTSIENINDESCLVYEFTVTNQKASASIKLPCNSNVSSIVYYKNTHNADCYTQTYFTNDNVQSIPTLNNKSVDTWLRSSSSKFYVPTQSDNYFCINMNRQNHSVGSKFYIAIQGFYKW